MRLDLERQYHNYVVEVEKNKNMNDVTSAERIGIEKGLYQGSRKVFMKVGKRA